MTKRIKEKIVELLRAGITITNRKPQNEVGHTDFENNAITPDNLAQWKRYGIEYDGNDIDDILRSV